MTTPDTRDGQLRAEALEQLRKRSELWAHLAAYLLVNTFLIAIWFTVGGGFFWPLFPLFGWGIGLFFHAWDVFRRPRPRNASAARSSACTRQRDHQRRRHGDQTTSRTSRCQPRALTARS